jgi:hypothetical protein
MTSMRLKILYVGRGGAVRRRFLELLEQAGYVATSAPQTPTKGRGGASAAYDLVVRDGVTVAELEEVLRPRRGGRSRAMAVTAAAGTMGDHPRRTATAARNRTPITLRALRESVGKTQGEVARKTSMSQPQLSRVETRRDHLISTLRKYVRALGGEVEVIAVVGGTPFPLRDV